MLQSVYRRAIHDGTFRSRESPVCTSKKPMRGAIYPTEPAGGAPIPRHLGPPISSPDVGIGRAPDLLAPLGGVSKGESPLTLPNSDKVFPGSTSELAEFDALSRSADLPAVCGGPGGRVARVSCLACSKLPPAPVCNSHLASVLPDVSPSSPLIESADAGPGFESGPSARECAGNAMHCPRRRSV